MVMVGRAKGERRRVTGSAALVAGLGSLAIGVTAVWSALLTVGLVKLIGLVTPLRVDQEAEHDGLDLTSHGERAYEFTP